MDVENLAKELILKNMTPEQQMAVLDSVRASVAQAKEVQKRKIGENVDLVVQALKKIESDIRSRFDDVGNSIEKRVASIKDGRDGINGKDGRDGKDGRSGKDGAKGDRGDAGRDGRDGVDGVDGVSVTAARIDFDGSLVITLSSGVELNVGEVVAPDLAERIKVITNGGGTSQSVLDTLASLQTQINNLIPSQTGNSGKFLTTNGSTLSWGNVAGALNYQGTWNASTNSPTLTSSVGTSGYYYVVDTAGSTNLNGITDWKAGDWLIFNGTVWQKIDQSWAIAGANDNITSMTGITGGISSPDFIQFDTAATVTNATGKLYYNSDDQFQTLSFQMNGNQVQHIGEELYYRVKLSSAATKGQVLMFTGTLGASGGLTAAPATGLQPEQAHYILGVAGETGSTNDWIFVTTFGEVKSINTTGGAESWAQGDVLYYNPSVTGGLTKTKPSVPNAICIVAAVVHVGSSNGVLFVRPTYGSVLGGTDGNVNFTSLASGNTLIYDAVAGVWENAFLTDGTGISITEGAGTITITNSAPDQTVALTGAGTTSISGTYPNFTITSNDAFTGTVTSVTGTSPVASSGGTTPAISLASGYGDTQNPYASKTANYVLASPNGSSGVPTFRAIVAADIPTLNQNTTGTASNVTGTVAIANGGTGQTTATAGFNALAPSQSSNSGKYLTTDGTNTSWASVSASMVYPSAGVAVSTGTAWGTSLVATSANTASALVQRGASGQITVGDVTTNRPSAPTTGYIYWGNSGTKYIGFDGTNIVASQSPAFSITGNAATAGGFTPSASAGVGNRIVVADSNGYIFNTYFNSTDNAITSGVTAIMAKQGSDYYRSASAAAVAAFVSGQSIATTGNISGTNTVGKSFNAGNAVIGNATGGLNTLEVLGTGNAAMMTFHRPGAFAGYFGLDSDNVWKVGGWSYGGASYPLLYSGSTTAPGSAPVYASRAWVNFNGTGTVAIRASGNVTSITDNGTGDYTVNFTTAMSDANYSYTGCGSLRDGVSNNVMITVGGDRDVAPTSSALRINTIYNNSGVNASIDSGEVCVSVFR